MVTYSLPSVLSMSYKFLKVKIDILLPFVEYIFISCTRQFMSKLLGKEKKFKY